MNDLIHRAALMKELHDWMSTLELREMVESAPAVDAEPVKHGEWRVVDCSYWKWRHDTGYPVIRKKYVCPECGRQTVIKENFCPKCGTKMDGGKHESSD